MGNNGEISLEHYNDSIYKLDLKENDIIVIEINSDLNQSRATIEFVNKLKSSITIPAGVKLIVVPKKDFDVYSIDHDSALDKLKQKRAQIDKLISDLEGE